MTEPTRAAIRRLFAETERAAVEALLEQPCGVNLPLTELWGEAQFERVWLAVLKLSGGRLDRLHETIGVAQRDWRDVLVGAGFGQSLEAHRAWARTLTS